jgi:hypothetical protein
MEKPVQLNINRKTTHQPGSIFLPPPLTREIPGDKRESSLIPGKAGYNIFFNYFTEKDLPIPWIPPKIHASKGKIPSDKKFDSPFRDSI